MWTAKKYRSRPFNHQITYVAWKYAITVQADDPCFTAGIPAPHKRCVFSCLHQICEVAVMRYKQWKNRELRQRQRANYKRLWNHLPFICAVLQLMVLVVIEELHQLPRSSENRHRSTFIKYAGRNFFFFLRKDKVMSELKAYYQKWTSNLVSFLTCIRVLVCANCVCFHAFSLPRDTFINISIWETAHLPLP